MNYKGIVIFFMLVLIINACTVTRYPAKTYLRDSTGYYNWDNIVDDSQKAKYYVIVGSFPEMDDAVKFKNKLEIQAYPVVILPIEDGKIRVSLGVYAYKANAEKIKNEYKLKNPDMIPWIMIK